MSQNKNHIRSKSELEVDLQFQPKNTMKSQHSRFISEHKKFSPYTLNLNENNDDNVGRIEGDNDYKFNLEKFNFKNNISAIENETGQNTTRANLINRTLNQNQNKNQKNNSISLKNERSKNPSQIPVTPDAFNLNDMMMETYNEKNIKFKTETVSQDTTNDDFGFVQKINKNEQECDNDYETNDLFVKLKIEEFHCAFYTFVSICSALIYHDINTYGASYDTFTKNKGLYDLSLNVSVIIISLGVLMFSKYYNFLKKKLLKYFLIF